MDASGPPLSAGHAAHGSPADPAWAMMQAMLTQQQQMQMQQQQMFEAMMVRQGQQLATVLQQQQSVQGQPAAAAQLLALSSLGQLRAFDGRSGANGLAA